MDGDRIDGKDVHMLSMGSAAERLEAIDRMVAEGADAMLAWAMPDDPVYPLLHRRGFHNLPARLSPVELHLGYRSLDGASTLDRDGLRWSYLDSDTV